VHVDKKWLKREDKIIDDYLISDDETTKGLKEHLKVAKGIKKTSSI
jgi:hypothetical protein